jgi:FKBP-type peptidyl-prolyl cis-trans isomerase
MGRRSRGPRKEDQYDDSLERSFYAKRSKPNLNNLELSSSSKKKNNQPKVEINHSNESKKIDSNESKKIDSNESKKIESNNNSSSSQQEQQEQQHTTKSCKDEDVERLQEKKRLKKQRQKEKTILGRQKRNQQKEGEKINLEPSSSSDQKDDQPETQEVGIDHISNESKNIESSNTSSLQQEQQQHTTKLSKDKDEDDIERLREKKRLKKERQKEKKLEFKKEQEKLKTHRENQKKEREKQKVSQKKQKDLEQRAPDVKTFVNTSMGVKYIDILVGRGPELVDRKRVVCQYVLRALHKTGKVVDSGDNFSFKYGKGEVIKGWEIGLEGMRQGGRRHVIVPSKAGYGMKDIGAGKGATLYFEVNLLKC